MPTITRQPGDETALANSTVAPGQTDTATGGFPAKAGRAVSLLIDGDTTYSISTVGDAANAVQVDLYVEYTTDGSSWTTIAAFTSGGQLNPGSETTDSGGENPGPQTIALGNLQDLSLLDVRARTVISVSGPSPTVTTCTAQVTDWEISFGVAVGIIGSE